MHNETCSAEAGSCHSYSHALENHEEHHCEDMPDKLLEVAGEAWMELLKEKIKKEIEASCGEHLNKVPKLVSERNKAKWSYKMAAKQSCHEYQHNLMSLFSPDHCQK